MENNVSIANFNVTFGEKEEPMLCYFDTVVFPAFKSEFVREFKERTGKIKDKFYFLNVRIVESEESGYVLTGQFVRETELEVKSIVRGKQIEKRDDHYPSAPYSVFYIYLKNHRMILIKNQKGSPGIKQFSQTVSYTLRRFIREYNRESVKSKLPRPMINVVGIPSTESVEETFRNVTKVNKLVLRFFPLNGDLDLTPTIENLTRDIRVPAGANTGNITLNSCNNKKGVIDVLNGLQGVMEPALNVDMGERKGIRIKNNILSENMTWNLNEDSINDETKVLKYASKSESIRIVSAQNQVIYDNNMDKIEKML